MSSSPPRTLYLVRHAIAAERGADWPDDSKRPLTDRGKTRMRQVVEGLVRLGLRVDVVLTSPLVRAVETAELLIDGLESEPALEVTTSLAPGQPWSAVMGALAGQPAASTVALVGHEPDLGELAAALIEASQPLVFKKGGVCRIDLAGVPPQSVGQLIWHATPRMLRAMAND